MTSHRDGYNDVEWAELKRGPIAAIYRVSLSTLAVAADLAHEFLAADDAIHDFVRNKPLESLVAELFREGLCAQDLKRMVAQHYSAQQALDLVVLSARLAQTHHPDASDAYTSVVMKAARTAANAVKEVSIPGYKRITEAEERAMCEIEEALFWR